MSGSPLSDEADDAASYNIAKQIAVKAVERMLSDGYRWTARRSVFAYSDTLDLAEEIHGWMLEHLEKRA